MSLPLFSLFLPPNSTNLKPHVQRAFLFSKGWKQMQRSTTKCCTELQKSGWREERGITRTTGAKIITEEPKERDVTWALESSPTLNSEPPAREHAWEITGSLHAGDKCVTWSICGTPISGIKTCPWSINWLFCILFPMKGGFALPYLRGMFLVLPQLEVESYVESIGRPASFCKEKEWMGVDIDRRRGQGKGRKEGGGSGEKKVEHTIKILINRRS